MDYFTTLAESVVCIIFFATISLVSVEWKCVLHVYFILICVYCILLCNVCIITFPHAYQVMIQNPMATVYRLFQVNLLYFGRISLMINDVDIIKYVYI